MANTTLDFAQNLIRAPYLVRLLDKTFQSTILGALGAIGTAYAVWQTPGVPVSDKINVTMIAITAVAGIIGALTASEKKKDRAIATAAIYANTSPSVSETPVSETVPTELQALPAINEQLLKTIVAQQIEAELGDKLNKAIAGAIGSIKIGV